MAENGLQAQRKILAGNYDLVITDINMPEMNGLELLLKKHRPQIEGIVMTGYEITDILSNEQLGWITDYLIKPFPMGKLQEVVERSMKRLKSLPKKNAEKGG